MIRLVAMLSLVLMAAPLMAQVPSNCAPRDHVAGRLSEKYQERVQAMGLDAQGNLMELWASEGGTWPIIVSLPNGLSCLVGSAQAFGTFAPSHDAFEEPA